MTNAFSFSLKSCDTQKEKNEYLILKRMYGIQKDGTDELICSAAVETQT